MAEFDWSDFSVSAGEPGKKKSFAVLEEGNYRAFAEDAVWQENRKGTGKYLKLTVSILDDCEGDETFKGSKVWDYINLVHQKENVVRIARQQMEDLCKAMGYPEGFKPDPSGGEDFLLNRPFGVRIKHEEYQGEPSPKIHWYFPLEGTPPPTETKAKVDEDDCPF